MSYRFLIFLALISDAAAAERIVAVATAKYASFPKAQNLSTEPARDLTPNADGEVLVSLAGWQRYRLSGLRANGGIGLRDSFALWRLDAYKGGRYLFVLERLPPVDAKRFRATYKIVDSAPVSEFACLDNPLPIAAAKEFRADRFGGSCYVIHEALTAPHVR